MPQPINFLTKKIAVTNSHTECVDIIAEALSELFNKPHKPNEKDYGFQFKARRGFIYEPELVEINIINSSSKLQYSIVQFSFGLMPKGFGKKSATITRDLLEKGINEVMNLILPKLKLIGVEEQNICLSCGKVNFPMAGFCVECNKELREPMIELGIKEVKSIVDDVGIIEEEVMVKSVTAKKPAIPDIMDTITDIIDGKVDPENLKKKK